MIIWFDFLPNAESNIDAENLRYDNQYVPIIKDNVCFRWKTVINLSRSPTSGIIC